jgi:hypothetical protein
MYPNSVRSYGHFRLFPAVHPSEYAGDRIDILAKIMKILKGFDI